MRTSAAIVIELTVRAVLTRVSATYISGRNAAYSYVSISVVPRYVLEVPRPRTRYFAVYAVFAVSANRNTALLKVSQSIPLGEANSEPLSYFYL